MYTTKNIERAETKLSYQSPELRVYGDVAKLTQNISGMSGNDHAGNPNKTK